MLLEIYFPDFFPVVFAWLLPYYVLFVGIGLICLIHQLKSKLH